jgi:hypothetical protein
MAPVTRSKAKSKMADITFDHVMTHLINYDKTTETYKCLVENSITTAAEITDLSAQVLDQLTYDTYTDAGDIAERNIHLPIHSEIVYSYSIIFLVMYGTTIMVPLMIRPSLN